MKQNTQAEKTDEGTAPRKTERGWELCDSNGIFESLETSIVYPTKRQAQQAADEANFAVHGFDELCALEALIP